MINNYIARQLGNPTGLGGKLIMSVMNQHNKFMYDETAALLSLQATDKVLDIGCGNGYMLQTIAARYGCTSVGIDISESILKAAAKRNRKFVKADMMAFKHCMVSDMPTAAFNKAYTINTVYFWESLGDTMAEIRRVLKPDGIFVNTLYTNEALDKLSHTTNYKRFTTKQLTDAAQAVGFKTRLSTIENKEAYCIVCY